MGEVPLLQCGVHPEEVSRPKGSARPGARERCGEAAARAARQAIGGFVSLPFDGGGRTRGPAGPY
jgi:endonuclease YncB( thermonuclease family)